MTAYNEQSVKFIRAGANSALVVDMSQSSGDVIQRQNRQLQPLLDIFSEIYLIGPEGTTDFDLDGIDCIEADSRHGQVERLCVAIQMVKAEQVVVANTPVDFESTELTRVLDSASSCVIIELDLMTELEVEPGSRHWSSRTVVSAFDMDVYNELRGFDMRIRTVRDTFNDFVRRARAWGENTTHVTLNDSVAIAPELVEVVAPQSYPFLKSSSIFVNLPRWKYRPFSASQPIQIVRINSAPPQSFDAVSAQSLDGYEVIDLTCAAGAEMECLEDYLLNSGRKLTAVVATGQSVPPWRLVEQLQHIKTGDTYCVGKLATHVDGELVTLGSAPSEQPLEDPSIYEISTVFGPSDVTLDLIHGSALASRRRAQTNKVVIGAEKLDVGNISPVLAPIDEARGIEPYVPGGANQALLLFDQFTVGKVDYIGAYDRVAGIATIVNAEGEPKREYCVVESPTQRDIDVLADLGLPFELVSFDYSRSSIIGILVAQLLNKTFKNGSTVERVMSCTDSTIDSVGHLYVQDGAGAHAWFKLTEGTEAQVDDLNNLIDPLATDIGSRWSIQ